MFDDIKTTWRPLPIVSIIFTVTFTAVTLATVFFTNLQNSMGCYTHDCSFIQRLTVTYQHGFNEISAMVHLIVDIVLVIMLGTFVEKVIGNFRFFILVVCTMFVYTVIHNLFNMIGHGASPIVYAFVPITFYCLTEGRLIKTRSAYDDHFRELRNALIVVVFFLPVLFSFVPINFSADISWYDCVIYGNLFNVIGLACGIVFLRVFKNHIRSRLKVVARKKKFDPDIFETETRYLAIATFPLIAMVAFLLR
ncbi:MAG TPA: hypothetical protein VK177_12250 [Flavobacteriales bacterium]|nr:hypothetical protein [Flavobacteriales bacterium]